MEGSCLETEDTDLATGAQPAITLMHGKHTTVLEMEFCVLDSTTLTDSPYRSDQTDPQSILVMMTMMMMMMIMIMLTRSSSPTIWSPSIASPLVFLAMRTLMQWTCRRAL